MKKRSMLLGCVVLGLLVAAAIIVGAGWWFFGRNLLAGGAPQNSPVQVYLLSPTNGGEVHAGDFVPVNLSAQAPAGIDHSELFVDGQSLGSVSDSAGNASWTWQAWPPGIHSLSARATDSSGHVGDSQTVIINVVALDPAMQISAGEGETLGQVGDKFGVPPDKMAAANPHVDPNQKFKGGEPVDVPLGGAQNPAPPSSPPAGGGSAGPGPILSVVWELKLTEAADKSYCYISMGDGIWDKLPKLPFDFFQGTDNVYTQLLQALPPPNPVVQADCWGWFGGALKYLGQAEGKLDLTQPGVQLVLQTGGFQLQGALQFPGGSQPQAYQVKPQIEGPYALREPTSTSDCIGHKGNSLVCDQILNAPLKTDVVLEWEWQPGVHWPNDPAWITQINGYDIYQIDPVTHAQQLMKQITPAAAKAGALPLGWGPTCYGVDAYADAPQYGGKITSKLTQYCPGQPPALQKMGIAPSAWVTESNGWFDLGSCPENQYYEEGYDGININTPTVLVGSWLMEGGDCQLNQGDFHGGFRFSPISLPAGAVFQKAVLRLSVAHTLYGATHVTIGAALPSCVGGVGAATQDWSSLNVAPHVFRGPIFTAAFTSPYASWGIDQADVTPIVADWLQHPGNNHGIYLTPTAAPKPLDVGDLGSGVCLSWIVAPALDVYYFAP